MENISFAVAYKKLCVVLVILYFFITAQKTRPQAQQLIEKPYIAIYAGANVMKLRSLRDVHACCCSHY